MNKTASNPRNTVKSKKYACFLSLFLCFTLLFATALSAAATENTARIPTRFYQKEIAIDADLSTKISQSFAASTPAIVSFTDYKGAFNVAYYVDQILHIDRYDSKLNLFSSLNLEQDHLLFGNIICDEQGYYYVCMGCCPTEKQDPVITLIKYDYNGNLIAQIEFNGEALAPHSPADYWGTKYPFDAGTCALALNNGILACNFAREMYSGHQSNMVFYADTQTMQRVSGQGTYCSHSFDQDCIATSDGGFLMANHGDAYPRSFVVTKVNSDRTRSYDIDTFHFREGTNRDHGYNETYTQLGGLAETENAYILCAASERTLSLDTAPTKEMYCSYSEARDLFVQILKKDYYGYDANEAYYVAGETRTATGKRPQTAETDFFLSAGTTDYGVIWLTDYEDTFFAASPKILIIEDNRLLIMWEKRECETYVLSETFYMILNEDGTVEKEATSIGRISLPANADLVYSNNTVYWTVGEYKWIEEFFRNEITINILNLSQPLFTDSNIACFSGAYILISEGCTAEQLLSQCEEGAYITNADGTECNGNAPATGMNLVFNEQLRYTVVMPGDADGDAKVSVADARLALRAAVGLENYAKNSIAFAACNVNGDDLSPSDSREILRVAVSLDDAKQWLA